MKTQSRFFKGTALASAVLTAGLLLSTSQPATAGASTGTWRNYPYGIAAGPVYGGHHGYGGYGYQRPAYAYGSPYGQPYYGGRGYYDDGYYYRRRGPSPGAAIAAGVIGLTAGAILGSALSQQQARPSRVSCTQYRSYNPRTGTFIGRNGVRYACR